MDERSHGESQSYKIMYSNSMLKRYQKSTRKRALFDDLNSLLCSCAQNGVIIF